MRNLIRRWLGIEDPPVVYHFIGFRLGDQPITGGHHADYQQCRDDAEYLLKQGTWGIQAVALLDANGALVWYKERES